MFPQTERQEGAGMIRERTLLQLVIAPGTLEGVPGLSFYVLRVKIS